MDNLENRKEMRHFIVTASFMLIAIVIAFILASRNSQPAVAQVVDWCSQPGIIWCTNHEDFQVGLNLPSTNNIAPTPNTSWYAFITPPAPTPPTPITGGGVDRNDDQYQPTPIATETIRAGLPAKVVEVSSTIPARSGEIVGKKYIELNADTVFADNHLKSTYGVNTTNTGIFLSRKVRGLGANVANIGDGLYFSAWYRFPYAYKSMDTANNDNLMVMEFMTELNGNNWRVPWSVHLKYDAAQSKMFFRVDERSV